MNWLLRAQWTGPDHTSALVGALSFAFGQTCSLYIYLEPARPPPTLSILSASFELGVLTARSANIEAFKERE